MIDIAAIFGSKALDENKLLACGFERADGDDEEYLLASVCNVTGTVCVPMTSPHSKPGDVMTSPNYVCAGSETVLPFNGIRKCPSYVC